MKKNLSGGRIPSELKYNNNMNANKKIEVIQSLITQQDRFLKLVRLELGNLAKIVSKEKRNSQKEE